MFINRYHKKPIPTIMFQFPTYHKLDNDDGRIARRVTTAKQADIKEIILSTAQDLSQSNKMT